MITNNSGLAANADHWRFPDDITIEQVNGMMQVMQDFSSSITGSIIQTMLIKKLWENVAVPRVERELDSEKVRSKVVTAQAKVDVYVLLAQPGLGLIEALQNKQAELVEANLKKLNDSNDISRSRDWE